MRSRTLIFALVALAATALPSGIAADTTAEVLYDDGRAPETLSLVRLPDEDGWFLRAHDVARLFRATQFWNASTRKIVLGVGRTRFVFTVDTRVAVVDGEPHMMRTAVRYDEGFVLVPMEFVLEIASQYTQRGFEWNERERRLSVKGTAYNVTRVAFTSSAERTTAAIQLTEPLAYHVDTSTPRLVRLKLYGGRIDLRAFTVREARGFVAGVRAEQAERDAFVVIDIARGVRRVRVERVDEPPQLLVVLETGDVPADAAPGVVVIDEGAEEKPALQVRKVCIDPGHGGRDLGKESPDGLMEKDVNLAIARIVRDRLQEELGVEIVMTRDDDRTLELLERTEIANTSGADLFISIHCNSWFNEQTGGFESYFLSPARSESERALARFENQGGGTGAAQASTSDVEFILWDLVQNEYIAESSTLAEYIQKEMTDRLGIKSRGVKQANFVVLQGARMPAVLIETAFLSNPAEERLLADAEFHGRVAEGLIEAIRRLQERYR